MAPRRVLRIAWLGAGPAEGGSAGGVMTELLDGLSSRGYEIDCYFPGRPRELPARLAAYGELQVIWGGAGWNWNRWYSSTRFTAAVSGMLWRAGALLRLRRELRRRHRERRYDLIFQTVTVESLGVPPSVARSVPMVIRPDTYAGGELRHLLRERRLALACQPWYLLAGAVAVTAARSVVQYLSLRRATMLVCISRVFRDHITRDYRYPAERSVVVHNAVNLDRYTNADAGRPVGDPPVILVPTRIAVRKGIEDVVAIARALLERKVDARIRIIGGPSLFSDYTPLLAGLPAENAEHVGHVKNNEMEREYERAALVLLPSRFDPCPMSILEALASGVPVVASSEVGSIEDVDAAVAAKVSPGDLDGFVAAIEDLLARLAADPAGVRALARAEAERLFSQQVICEQLADALEGLLAGAPASVPVAG